MVLAIATAAYVGVIMIEDLVHVLPHGLGVVS
jgi:hypothetical protein